MKLNQTDLVEEIFDGLIQTGRQRLSERQTGDFFAKFGEGQTSEARKASAHYTLGLGYLGKGQSEAAKAEFEKAVELNVSHTGIDNIDRLVEFPTWPGWMSVATSCCKSRARRRRTRCWHSCRSCAHWT